jgi:hypothetical protein
MKSAVLFLFLLAAISASAQDVQSTPASAPDITAAVQVPTITYPTAAMRPITYADRYCSGFVTREKLPQTVFISGSPNSPHATKLGSRDIVYITGQNLRAGMQFNIVRELRDPNRSELFQGQHGLVRKAGQVYAELGRVRVLDARQKRQKMTIGVIEFGCKVAVPGDLLIPFVERPPVAVPGPAPLDRFAPASGNLTGRILMAQDSDSVLGVGQKIYLSLGSEQRVKAGDVFRVFRAPEWELRDEVDALSYKATMVEDSQNHPAHISTGGLSLEPEFLDLGSGPKIKVADLPRRIVGKVVVLNVTPTSATAMIMVAVEDIRVGDGVEAETTAAGSGK